MYCTYEYKKTTQKKRTELDNARHIHQVPATGNAERSVTTEGQQAG